MTNRHQDRNAFASAEDDNSYAGTCFVPTAKFDLTHPILSRRRLSWMVEDILTIELEPASSFEVARARCAGAANNLAGSGLYPSTKVVLPGCDPSRYCLVDTESRIVVEFSVVHHDHRNGTVH